MNPEASVSAKQEIRAVSGLGKDTYTYGILLIYKKPTKFREGVAINQSLQCLGHCIHALAESSSATTSSNGHNNGSKSQRIPYRDSVLTKLLMNALGGNSKTIMVC